MSHVDLSIFIFIKSLTLSYYYLQVKIFLSTSVIHSITHIFLLYNPMNSSNFLHHLWLVYKISIPSSCTPHHIYSPLITTKSTLRFLLSPIRPHSHVIFARIFSPPPTSLLPPQAHLFIIYMTEISLNLIIVFVILSDTSQTSGLSAAASTNA